MNNELALYAPFIKEIKELIYRHQYEAMKKVNIELLTLYWKIGHRIDFRQREQGWGKSVVEFLSKELQKEFPGDRGYSARNLWRMRNFYLEYSNLTPSVREVMEANLQKPVSKIADKDAVGTDSEILPPSLAELEIANLPPLLAEISWTKNYAIVEKCKDPMERIFYIKATRRFGWTHDVLIHNIDVKAYERYLTNQTNFDETVPEKYRLQAKLAVKDEYNFNFLEVGEEHSEAELEAAIMKNLRKFLIEMGGYFTFVRDQYYLDVTDEDYHIDLLLFHRRLRSLIAIELKIGEFKPEYIGKMQFYLTSLDETVKLPDENPSIGIIICKSKHRTRVEYTLRTSYAPIGVATYSTQDSLPDNLRALLPSPDELARIVGEFDDDEVGLLGFSNSDTEIEDDEAGTEDNV
ncbi:MAG: PDDEXK nuclease domain-containing protein [Oscillospiraceae bacterium]|nr:PDDEXK nuclease domain-containing protein [Oscillospiraceae bacterium]